MNVSIAFGLNEMSVCPSCGADRAEWLELGELRRRGWSARVPQLERVAVDALGLLVAACRRCGRCWWIGPVL